MKTIGSNIYLSAQQIITSLLGVDDEYTFYLPVGVEIEVCVFNEKNQPVDLTLKQDFLHKMLSSTGAYNIYIEAASNILEIALPPVTKLSTYVRSIVTVFNFLQNEATSSSWLYVFGDNSGKINVNPRPLYKAFSHALGPNAEKQLTKYTSLQINFGVEKIGGPFSNLSKKILYVLNNLSLPIALYFEKLANVKSQRLQDVFSDFNCEAIRLPHPLSKQYVDNIEKNILNIPYLVLEKKTGSDIWIPAKGQKPEKINDFHTITIWWFARYRGLGILSEERIEFRAITSVPPIYTIQILKMMNQLIYYLCHHDDIELIDDSLWWKLRRGDKEATKYILNWMDIIFSNASNCD